MEAISRHSFRADWHDYGDGVYFVTICSHDKQNIFGHIVSSEIYLSPLGQLIAAAIADLPNHPPHPEVLNSVVMPNHVHILVGARPAAPTPVWPDMHENNTPNNIGCLKPPLHGEPRSNFHHNSTLSVIIGALKSAVTRKYRKMSGLQGKDMRPIWQRLYHEHIVRSQRAFDNIMDYIDNNVGTWGNDTFNKER